MMPQSFPCKSIKTRFYAGDLFLQHLLPVNGGNMVFHHGTDIDNFSYIPDVTAYQCIPTFISEMETKNPKKMMRHQK